MRLQRFELTFAPAFTQLLQGNFLSHFTLRLWQRMQASTRCGFAGPAGVLKVDEDM